MNYFCCCFLFFYLSTVIAQSDPSLDQLNKVDYTEITAEVTILPVAKTIQGKVAYDFNITQELDSIYLDAKNMEFSQVLLNGVPVAHRADATRLWIQNRFVPSQNYELSLQYIARPKQSMYFINWELLHEIGISRQVWTQGQGRYTSHWLPSLDDPRDKAVFQLSINFPSGYEVISNGVLQNKKTLNDSLTQWNYVMEKPMSSYLLAIAAGDYEVEQRTTGSGIPISLFYEAKDATKVEPTYRYTLDIFDFFENVTGHPYPWQNYKQIPVQDFLYSGMENTGATIFSQAMVVDSIAFNDQNYISVNAHELAHQWFGNLVTAASDDHHWLQEGFATYYALLAERELFGEDYYFWRLFEYAEELKAMSDRGKGESLLRAGGSSVTYYRKGAWALHILKEKVGEMAFNEGVRNYLHNNAYQIVTTNDFIKEVAQSSGQDLEEFVNDWLEQSAFQGTEALNSLKVSGFIRNYMEIAGLREVAFTNKMELLRNALNFPVNDYIGQEVVFQLEGENSAEAYTLYKKAFDSNNLYVRQAIATSLQNIPDELKGVFVRLLDDDSYLTKEHALLKLWLQYPQEAAKYLEKTKNIHGFSNKNVRLVWLVLNLVTPTVEKELKDSYYLELSNYTLPQYPFELRQNAFGYLYQINAFSKQNLLDLIQAGQHHNTRFRDYARQLLETLLEEEQFRERFVSLQPELSEKDRTFLLARLKS